MLERICKARPDLILFNLHVFSLDFKFWMSKKWMKKEKQKKILHNNVKARKKLFWRGSTWKNNAW